MVIYSDISSVLNEPQEGDLRLVELKPYNTEVRQKVPQLFKIDTPLPL